MKLTTAEQMRGLDRKAIEERHISSVDLMERAAQAICTGALELIADQPGRRRAAVFCGSGNNGGDGIAAARLLFLAGVRVRTFLVGRYEKLTPDALEMTGRLSECGVELEPFDPEDDGQRAWVLRSDVLIDALFGVGLSREIEQASSYGEAVALLNEAPGKVVSADIPSGVCADSGSVLGMAVKADRTITFTLPKIGHYAGDGGVLSGEVLVRDIGIPTDLVRGLRCAAQTAEGSFAHAALPPRKPDGHKGDFGKVLVVGGSVGFTGAPYLAAEAAMRTGCGLVSLGVPESIWKVEASRCISTMPFPLNDHQSFTKNTGETFGLRCAGSGTGIGAVPGCDASGAGTAAGDTWAGSVGRGRHKRAGGAYGCVGCQKGPSHDSHTARWGICTNRRGPVCRTAGGCRCVCREPWLHFGPEGIPDADGSSPGKCTGEYHRQFGTCKRGERRHSHRDHCLPAGAGGHTGPSGSRRRLSPRESWRSDGVPADGVRHDAGGCRRHSAGGDRHHFVRKRKYGNGRLFRCTNGRFVYQ